MKKKIQTIIKSNHSKKRHYKKILAIIESCRNISHVESCNVIIKNFFRLHEDVELHSILIKELKFKRLTII